MIECSTKPSEQPYIGQNKLPQCPRIGIIGSGAIGSFYGAMLVHAGHDVHFLMRTDYEAVKKDGLRIEYWDEREVRLPEVQAYDDPKAIGPCDLVLIALKTTANEHMPKLVHPLVGSNTLLLTMQNGMGNAECLAEHFGARRVLGAICFISLNRVGHGHVLNLYDGYITLAEYQGGAQARTEALKSLFDAAGIRCDLRESLEESLWRKLCWNIPFNGLAIAGGGISTQEILEQEGLAHEVWLLMKEVQTAADAHGFPIEEEFLEKQIAVTRKMGAYKPSSVLDYLQQRPVEREAIWGVPLKKGTGARATMPKLEMLYHLIGSLTRTVD